MDGIYEEKEKEHIGILSIDNNPNVGLFAFANDKFCLVGYEISNKDMASIGKVLDVPVYRISIAGTSLIGVFCAGNSNTIVVPHIIQKQEEEKLTELGIEYKKIYSKITALGNCITSNDNGAIVSSEFSEEEIDKISRSLGVRTKKGKISELNTMGSCLEVNNRGGIVHRGIKGFELELLEDALGIEIVDGTVNMGNPYVGSGIITNSKGFIIGASSGGPEITNADIALGFMKEE